MSTLDIDELKEFYIKNIPVINEEFEFIDIKKIGKGKNDTLITILHKKCGRQLDILYHNFKYRKNCKYCDLHYYDTDSFITKFNQRSDSKDYTIIGEFTGITKFISVKHNICGKIFDIRADTLLYRNGVCPCINNKYSSSHDFNKLKERITSIDSNYELISSNMDGEFSLKKVNVTILHKICNNTFTCIPHNFIHNNQRCPYCTPRPKNLIGYKDSKGVLIIKDWIEEKGLYYEREKKFDSLVSPYSGKPLRYDFYIPDINLIIEFDGKQHYDTRTSSLFTKEKYDRIRAHDKIKNKFCKKNDINLIRIKYSDSSKEYIYKKLNKFFYKKLRIYVHHHYNKSE